MKVFLRFCLDHILSVDLKTEKSNKIVAETMRLGFHVVHSSTLNKDNPKLKLISEPLKELSKDVNDKKAFSSILAICKSHSVNAEIEVHTDVEKRTARYCLNLGKEKACDVPFFIGKTTLPHDGSKAGKLSDKLLRNVFLKGFLMALSSQSEDPTS